MRPSAILRLIVSSSPFLIRLMYVRRLEYQRGVQRNRNEGGSIRVHRYAKYTHTGVMIAVRLSKVFPNGDYIECWWVGEGLIFIVNNLMFPISIFHSHNRSGNTMKFRKNSPKVE